MTLEKVCKLGLCLVVLLSNILIPTVSQVAQAASTAPILVVVNNATPEKFGSYLEEILRAEGLNSFDILDINVNPLNSVLLSQYPLVILGQQSLNSSQSSVLSDYVSNGGHLIAMRPASQIKTLFGLGASAGLQNGGYLKIDDTALLGDSIPGQGLITDTLQIHSNIDRYEPGSATVLAGLYSSATTATAYPAVVGKTVGTGKAVAFLYDLPTNIIYTRQGNPTNGSYVNPVTHVTGDVDGDGIFRTIDLFQTIGGGAPWEDLNKVPIPQADIQMRFFARLVKQMVGEVQPMPTLWYFSGNAKSTLVMTADLHANLLSSFEAEVNSLITHLGHMTFYLSIGETPDPASIQKWLGQGFTFGIHPYASRDDVAYPQYKVKDLQQGYQVFNTWFQTRYGPPVTPSIPRSVTVRNHAIAWAGWTDSASYADSLGIEMDTSFYQWGNWLKKADATWAHGYITGSGQPMKFVKADGTIIPVYQQLTQLVDEQMLMGAGANTGNEQLRWPQALAVSKQLLDASQSDFCETIVTQNHVDYYQSEDSILWAEGLMDYAVSQGIPIWNVDEWLSFSKTRHDANFSNFSWSNFTLAFDLASSGQPTGKLSVLLPLSYQGRPLLSVQVDGKSASYLHEAVNGISMAFVSVTPGIPHSFNVNYDPLLNGSVLANVAINFSSSPDPVFVGNPLTHTVTVQNLGPNTAIQVTAKYTLPAGTAYVSASGLDWNCSFYSGTVTCVQDILLANTSAPALTIHITTPLQPGQITSTMTVSSAAQDPYTPNNTVTIATANLTQVFAPLIMR